VLVGALLLLGLWWWARQRQQSMAETLEGERPA